MYHSAVGEVRERVGTDADSIRVTKVSTFVSFVVAQDSDVSKQTSATEALLAGLVSGMRSDWERLVLVVEQVLKGGSTDGLAEFVSKQTSVGVESIQRKIDAIVYHFQNLSLSAEEIIKLGQEQTVSAYIKSKKAEKYGKEVHLSFKVPGSQREIVIQEMNRIKKVLGMKDSEGYWDFILSLTRDLTPDELRHLAGKKLKKEP